MSDDATRTLFHPFEAGFLPMPTATMRGVFINAPSSLTIPPDFEAALELVQDMRPSFLALEAAGRSVSPQIGEGPYDVALILCGRHRGQNERWIAQALRTGAPGGLIVVAGAKMDGVASLRRRMEGLCDLEGHAAKYHGTVFWLRAPQDAERLARTLEEAAPEVELDAGYRTAPGMFSHERIDRGSALLAAHLPRDLKGTIADFGAGWGFLAVEVARCARSLERLDLYEASHAACEAARHNLATLAPDATVTVNWADLAAEKPQRRYNAIVMNPPFHQGRAAEPSLGEALIATAAAALKPRGRLLMVANRQLPYERALEKLFKAHGEIAREDGFKLLWAER